MAWYLYIVGILITIGLFATLNMVNEEDNRVHPAVYIVISAIWPVSFPALLVGGLLSLVLDGANGEE